MNWKRTVITTLAFTLGAAAWFGLSWLGGVDFVNMKRGADAVFHVCESFMCGVMGAVLVQIPITVWGMD